MKTSVEPLPPSAWDESLMPIIENLDGDPLNVHRLMANHPQLLSAWWNFRNHAVNGGALGKRLGELVILRVAVHMGSWYEWASHVDRSLHCGLSLDEINRVTERRIGPKWQANEACLLEAVDELIASHGLSSDLQSKMELYFSVEQVMDVIAIHGMYVVLACMIKTWGLKLDEDVQSRLPSTVTEDFFEHQRGAGFL
ncbi:MAG: carboxymuconolactone decarboxylase family protein [Pseudomonadota bacterium]